MYVKDCRVVLPKLIQFVEIFGTNLTPAVLGKLACMRELKADFLPPNHQNGLAKLQFYEEYDSFEVSPDSSLVKRSVSEGVRFFPRLLDVSVDFDY